MKNFKFCLLATIALLFGAVAFVACDKDEEGVEKEPDALSVSPKSFAFSADDNREKMAVITTNVAAWTAKTSGSWVILRDEGNKLYITVQPHTDTENGRTATVTVTAGDAPVETLSITQEAKEINSFFVGTTSLSFEADETGSKTVAISTNAESWSFTPAEVSWLTLTKQDDALKVTVPSKNTGTSARTVAITIKAGNASDITLTVTQAGTTVLSADPTSLSYEAGETGEKTIAVSTNAESWKSSKSASWITLIESGNTLKVNVTSKNTSTSPRSAEIKITAEKAPDVVVTVTQGAATTLSASPTALTYAPNETGEKTVTVSTNATAWEPTTTASWITLSKNGNTLKVNVTSRNTQASPRSADIKIKAGDAPEAVVTVTQRAATTLSVSPTALSYVASERVEKTVMVTTSASSWNATTSATWISLSKSGNTLTVKTLSNNSSRTARSADIHITAGEDAAVLLKATQAGETGDIVTSSYTATGTPKALDVPGPTSWSGTVTPTTVSSQKTYRISNWGGKGITVVCNEKNSKITIAQNEQVAQDGIYQGYFRACFISGNTLYYMDEDYEYPVTYTKSTQTLDFSGYLNGNQVIVGVIGIRPFPEEFAGFFTDLYANAKLKLTSTSSAQFSGDVVVKSSDIGKYEIKKVSYSEFIKIAGATIK